MSSIKDQSLTGFKWSAIGEVTIEDSLGHQTDMGIPEGLAGFAETDKPSYVLISFSHIEYKNKKIHHVEK